MIPLNCPSLSKLHLNHMPSMPSPCLFLSSDREKGFLSDIWNQTIYLCKFLQPPLLVSFRFSCNVFYGPTASSFLPEKIAFLTLYTFHKWSCLCSSFQLPPLCWWFLHAFTGRSILDIPPQHLTDLWNSGSKTESILSPKPCSCSVSQHHPPPGHPSKKCVSQPWLLPVSSHFIL